MAESIPRSRYLIFGLIVLVGAGADLLTKHWVFQRLGMPGGDTIWILPEYFGLQTSLNKGALFGFGQGNAHIFAALSVAAAIGIVYYLFFAGGASDRRLTVAMAMILAGIFGNLYDRLALWTPPDGSPPIHAVRDWILLQYGDHVWPNFNIADSLLVCSTLWLAWQFWVQPETPDKTKPVAAESAVSS